MDKLEENDGRSNANYDEENMVDHTQNYEDDEDHKIRLQTGIDVKYDSTELGFLDMRIIWSVSFQKID